MYLVLDAFFSFCKNLFFDFYLKIKELQELKLLKAMNKLKLLKLIENVRLIINYAKMQAKKV